MHPPVAQSQKEEIANERVHIPDSVVDQTELQAAPTQAVPLSKDDSDVSNRDESAVEQEIKEDHAKGKTQAEDVSDIHDTGLHRDDELEQMVSMLEGSQNLVTKHPPAGESTTDGHATPDRSEEAQPPDPAAESEDDIPLIPDD